MSQTATGSARSGCQLPAKSETTPAIQAKPHLNGLQTRVVDHGATAEDDLRKRHENVRAVAVLKAQLTGAPSAPSAIAAFGSVFTGPTAGALSAAQRVVALAVPRRNNPSCR